MPEYFEKARLQDEDLQKVTGGDSAYCNASEAYTTIQFGHVYGENANGNCRGCYVTGFDTDRDGNSLASFNVGFIQSADSEGKYQFDEGQIGSSLKFDNFKNSFPYHYPQ